MNSAQSPHVPEKRVRAFPPCSELLACTMLESMKSNTVPKLASPEVQLGHVASKYFKTGLRQLK